MHKLTCLLAAALWLAATPRVHAQVCSPAESWLELGFYFLEGNTYTAGVNEVRCVNIPEKQVIGFPPFTFTIDLSIVVILEYEGEAAPGHILIENETERILMVGNGQREKLPAGINRITILPLREGTATVTVGQDQGGGNLNPIFPNEFTVLANPAPVTWTRPLTYAPAGPDLELSWGVAEQVDVAGYTLERQNGADWEALQDVAYVESGAAEVVYTTRTPRPAGDAYYRIRQTDFDGSSSLSNVVHVPATEATALRVFPNPATGQANFTLPPAATFLTLTDATGRQVRNLAGAQLGDRRIDLGGLPAGLYTLTAYGRDARLGSERLLVR